VKSENRVRINLVLALTALAVAMWSLYCNFRK
jgi:hypothetical protein